MRTRLFALGLIGSMLTVLCPQAALALSFPDVPGGHSNSAAINFLSDKQIIIGYPDGEFKPDRPVNRAEAIKMISLAFDLKKENSEDLNFPDVGEDRWYYKYLLSGFQAGIIQGYPDGKFRPENGINLAETLKMVLKAANVEVSQPNDEDYVFVDVKKGQWFSAQAMYAWNKNIVLADDAGKIHPEKTMSRADFAELIYRMLKVRENQDKAFDLATNWSKVESGDVGFEMKYDPSEWEVKESSNQVIFFKSDAEMLDFSTMRIFDNSAAVAVELNNNSAGLNPGELAQKMREELQSATITEFNLDGHKAIEVVRPDEKIVDWHVFRDDKKVLSVLSQYGSGPSSYRNPRLIRAMMQSVKVREDLKPGENNLPVSSSQKLSDEEKQSILSDILANILLEDKGMENLNKLPDKIIIDTDTIGVGTGPVDYYYSGALDYTFKYEREADTLLDKREGRSSAF